MGHISGLTYNLLEERLSCKSLLIFVLKHNTVGIYDVSDLHSFATLLILCISKRKARTWPEKFRLGQDCNPGLCAVLFFCERRKMN